MSEEGAGWDRGVCACVCGKGVVLSDSRREAGREGGEGGRERQEETAKEKTGSRGANTHTHTGKKKKNGEARKCGCVNKYTPRIRGALARRSWQ